MKFTKLLILLIFCVLPTRTEAQSNSQILTFEFEGNTIHGQVITPANESKGMVLVVQGSGCYAAVEERHYYDVREMLVNSGYSTYIWDKTGCGQSEGTFDYNRTIQNSADEVKAAIDELKKYEIPGSDAVGLWGVSRAGWINPVVINQYPGIKFWITVSGVDAKENFGYLFEQNLRIEGLPEDSVQLYVEEWREGNRVTHSGAPLEDYLAVTPHLQHNKFLKRFNTGELTEEGYIAFQKVFMEQNFDVEDGTAIIVDDFDTILSQVDVPVLALFGELDMNVDWRKTAALYRETLNSNGHLTIESFPGCNHNMFKANTGGFYEFQDYDMPWDRCDGFLESMSNWLSELE